MAEDNSRTRVTILTNTFRIKGDIDLMPGARVTDYMMDTKAFFAVTGAEVWNLEGRMIFSTAFLNVSRSHVVVVSPD